ncbi:MAG: hypothetical protein ACRCW4_13370 [Candidatus Neomicrothrix subdominans]
MTQTTWLRHRGDNGLPLEYVIREEPTVGQRVGTPVDLTGAVVTARATRWSDRIELDPGPVTIVPPATDGRVTVPYGPALAASSGLHSVEFIVTDGPSQRTFPSADRPAWLRIGDTLAAGIVTGGGPSGGGPGSPVFIADNQFGTVAADGQVVLAGANATLTLDPGVDQIHLGHWDIQTPWSAGTTPTIIQAGATVDPTAVAALLASGGSPVLLARIGSVWYAAGSSSGGGGGGASYLHTQSVAATVWTVNHNLGVLTPDVTLADETGEEFETDIDYVTANQLIITSAAPVAGTALIQG